MIHKKLSNDNGAECYRCGEAIDYRDPEDDEAAEYADDWEYLHDQELIRFDISWLWSFCPGPSDKNAHHWIAVGSNDFEYADGNHCEHRIHWIECHYCDAKIDWNTDLNSIPARCKGER